MRILCFAIKLKRAVASFATTASNPDPTSFGFTNLVPKSKLCVCVYQATIYGSGSGNRIRTSIRCLLIMSQACYRLHHPAIRVFNCRFIVIGKRIVGWWLEMQRLANRCLLHHFQPSVWHCQYTLFQAYVKLFLEKAGQDTDHIAFYSKRPQFARLCQYVESAFAGSYFASLS